MPSLAANLGSIAGCSLVNFLVSEYIVFGNAGQSVRRSVTIGFRALSRNKIG